MSSLLLHPEVQTKKDFLPIVETDYIELYVGNARQSAYFYRAAFGMRLIALAGPETGLRDRASYVLQQGSTRLVLTTPLRPDGGMAEHIRRHGDGVRDVAITVADAKLAWRETTRRGARSVHECHELADDFGRVKVASIAAYGDTIHTFVERDKYYGPFLPGYEPVDSDPIARPVGITHIDHVAGSVGWNELRRWVDYYSDKLGFSLYGEDSKRESFPEYTAFAAQVCERVGMGGFFYRSKSRRLDGKSRRLKNIWSRTMGRASSISPFQPGIFWKPSGKMRRQGVQFKSVPSSYYEQLPARVGELDESVEDLKDLGILVDKDVDGYLLQAFTRPVEDRPTLFFEVIQRKGSHKFGDGNYRALPEAVESRTHSFATTN